MKRLVLFAAAISCVLGFVACNEEEKEEVTPLKPDVYYRLCSYSNTEYSDILIRELDKDSNVIAQSVIFSLLQSEKTDYRLTRPQTVFLQIYAKQTERDYFDNSTRSWFFTSIDHINRSNQYNDLYLSGVRITEAEYKEAFNN